MNEQPPEDLAGYQCVSAGIIEEGDILVSIPNRFKAWATLSFIGAPIESESHFDVYRKIPCPKAGDHDKEWKEVKKNPLKSFPTGSLRQPKEGKGRFDLIPYDPTKQLAIHFEEGGRVHGDRNWELGQPLSTYLSSAKRHAMQSGVDFSENHAIASCWNMFCLIQTAKWIEEGKLPEELDDINWLDNKKQP